MGLFDFVKGIGKKNRMIFMTKEEKKIKKQILKEDYKIKQKMD